MPGFDMNSCRRIQNDDRLKIHYCNEILKHLVDIKHKHMVAAAVNNRILNGISSQKYIIVSQDRCKIKCVSKDRLEYYMKSTTDLLTDDFSKGPNRKHKDLTSIFDSHLYYDKEGCQIQHCQPLEVSNIHYDNNGNMYFNYYKLARVTGYTGGNKCCISRIKSLSDIHIRLTSVLRQRGVSNSTLPAAGGQQYTLR